MIKESTVLTYSSDKEAGDARRPIPSLSRPIVPVRGKTRDLLQRRGWEWDERAYPLPCEGCDIDMFMIRKFMTEESRFLESPIPVSDLKIRNDPAGGLPSPQTPLLIGGAEDVTGIKELENVQEEEIKKCMTKLDPNAVQMSVSSVTPSSLLGISV
ncbi:hypothetical protein PoB_006359900 [Plakobranchus ocellatus]|uniref:Uncharacterized protein n=1 Tax=Plakobranchus ocellatus TaxID=259542 RepID=A0AAV4CYV8_9GAST|nr:hypothetical protein PoB_006359900 [Plakobranchus ocellatus]